MIPIGAPVSFEFNKNKKIKGIVLYYHKDIYPTLRNCVEVEDVMLGWEYLIHVDKIKIRYDAPAPFTLWTKNIPLASVAKRKFLSRLKCQQPLPAGLEMDQSSS